MRVIMVMLMGLAAASAPGAVAMSPDNAPEHEIVVTGDRDAEEAVLRDLTKNVAKPPPIDKPMPRFYAPICLKVIGIKADYAPVLIERITRNIREIGAVAGKEGCTPNALVIFTRDAKKAVAKLRESDPWIFTTVPDYEVKKILASEGPAYAWQTTELRGVDGKPLVYEVRQDGSMVAVNKQWQTGRLAPPIRLDFSGSVVLIDNAEMPGKSLPQLADYATFRLLSGIKEEPEANGAALPTILSLFRSPEDAPQELSKFDMAYLTALYGLRPNASRNAIRDATVQAYFGEGDDRE